MNEQQLDAAIARLTFLTHGHIGRDYRDGAPFVLAQKGDAFDALLQALDALRAARAEVGKWRAL